MPMPEPPSPMPGPSTIDPRAFRDVLGCFATGIVLVTGLPDGEPVGLTCQSFTSLSMDPPLVAFCPSRTSVSWRRIRATGAFGVSVLAERQRALSDLFAQRRDDKFARVDWHHGTTGAPLIDGAVAHLECEVTGVHAGGDHEIVIGRVVDLAGSADGGPLLYFRGRYATLTTVSGHTATG
jgi:3-hydroxy-9,10-secoandrosta-1,3,5(10)-triene-9,17-dione monooxygenase reductase component